MSTITQQTTAVNGNVITAAVWNDEWANIINDYNGNITNANIAADAAIALSKLATTPATLTGTETLTNKTLTSPAVNTPTTTGPIATLTDASDGSTITFDLANGPIHSVTLGGNRTLALNNSATGKVFVIRLIQDGSGSRTVTWFSTIKWEFGIEPTLSTTAADVDVFGFICTGANTYDGFTIGQALS